MRRVRGGCERRALAEHGAFAVVVEQDDHGAGGVDRDRRDGDAIRLERVEHDRRRRISAEAADELDGQVAQSCQPHGEVRALAPGADPDLGEDIGAGAHRPGRARDDVEQRVTDHDHAGHRGRRVEKPSRVVCQ